VTGDGDGVVFVWAGKTHNITCHVHAYPPAEIEWWRKGRKLANNLTYHVHVHNTHSNLQVRGDTIRADGPAQRATSVNILSTVETCCTTTTTTTTAWLAAWRSG